MHDTAAPLGHAARAGDAIIAGMRPTPEILARADVTYPYLKTPGRFVMRRDLALVPSPQALSRHTVAVATGTAHEAFLKAFFPAATPRGFSSAGAVFDALARGPYFESRFFGEGMTIAVRKGDDAMRRVLNLALQRLSQNGRLGDLYLKYFPVGFY